MSTEYQIDEVAGIYYLTFQIIGWLDIFMRKIYRDIVIESFSYCQQNNGLELFTYAIV